MPELVFLRRGEEVMFYHLDEGATRIGRGPQNDIAFPENELYISRYHAMLLEDHGSFWLRDLTGQGIVLNGNSCEEGMLKDGDRFELGSWEVIFRDKHRESGRTFVTKAEATLPMMQADETKTIQQAVLRYELNGDKREFALGKQPVNIGKSEQNDICIQAPFVSGFHCRVFWRDGRYFVRDLDSLNGTWVNGLRQVEGELPERAEIYVGQFPIQFFMKVAQEAQSPTEMDTEEFPGFCGIVSQNEQMKRLFGLVERVAANEAPVLIHGESGTGKELFAKAVHMAGPRKDCPFVAINCGAISKELVESTLFGHEKGAFTGAENRRIGAFEEAANGTLFLDEIGELPLALQVSLLRVLEVGTFRRMGGSEELTTQARVVTATHRSLEEQVSLGAFREDLFYRINILALELLPLRERKDDLPLLVRYFLKKFAGHRELGISKDALASLMTYSWPGNVRELRNMMQRAIVMVEGQKIETHDLSFRKNASVTQGASTQATVAGHVGVTLPFTGSKAQLEEVERHTIIEALNQSGGVVTEAARLLGIGRSSLYNKMKRLNIKHRKGRSSD